MGFVSGSRKVNSPESDTFRRFGGMKVTRTVGASDREVEAEREEAGGESCSSAAPDGGQRCMQAACAVNSPRGGQGLFEKDGFFKEKKALVFGPNPHLSTRALHWHSGS